MEHNKQPSLNKDINKEQLQAASLQQQNKKESQQIQQQQPNHKIEIRKELEAMQFEPHLIEQALATASNLEEAIENIILFIEAEEQTVISEKGQIQLLFFVRMDLKMGMGKIAAQCAHAALRIFQMARSKAECTPQYATTFIEWLQKGKKQIFYKVQDQQQLFSLLNSCKQLGALTTYIRDAGRTQIAAGSTTVGAIGPVQISTLRPIIQSLKLL